MKSIILAGGNGTRLWPLSRTSFPKQFLKLGAKESLLQFTVKRLKQICKKNEIYILTNEAFFHAVLKEVDLPRKNILVEPEQKNTAPAIAFALKYLLDEERISADETVLISPADHVINPPELFAKAIVEAEVKARSGHIVTFGIPPTRPETGFGYIKAGEGSVEKFVEKPTLKTATNYLLEGNYYWNSGMFLFPISKMVEELHRHAPAIGKWLDLPWEDSKQAFSSLPTISIDYAVMEKAKEIAFFPLHLSWCDVGSWDNVYALFQKDENGNAVAGNVMPIETKDSLLFSQKRLVATVGVENLLIVETPDAILVAKKEYGQNVKELVNTLHAQGKVEAHMHLTTQRPWGSYTVLEEGERYKIKRITVHPQSKLSLQLHYHRSEHWVVVSGTALVTIDGKESIVREGESIFVPKTSTHRVENPGKVSLEIIEVQVGEYLGEDDIVRLEDIYGRLKEDALEKTLNSSMMVT